MYIFDICLHLLIFYAITFVLFFTVGKELISTNFSNIFLSGAKPYLKRLPLTTIEFKTKILRWLAGYFYYMESSNNETNLHIYRMCLWVLVGISLLTIVTLIPAIYYGVVIITIIKNIIILFIVIIMQFLFIYFIVLRYKPMKESELYSIIAKVIKQESLQFRVTI